MKAGAFCCRGSHPCKLRKGGAPLSVVNSTEEKPALSAAVVPTLQTAQGWGTPFCGELRLRKSRRFLLPWFPPLQTAQGWGTPFCGELRLRKSRRFLLPWFPPLQTAQGWGTPFRNE